MRTTAFIGPDLEVHFDSAQREFAFQVAGENAGELDYSREATVTFEHAMRLIQYLDDCMSHALKQAEQESTS